MHRERIPDDEFIENARNMFEKLIGKQIQVTGRVTSKTDLRTYFGELLSVGKATFYLDQPRYKDGALASHEPTEYRLLDVHYYVPPRDFTGKWWPPKRFRRA